MRGALLLLFVACLTSQQYASVSQGRICFTSQQYASVSEGRICLTSQQYASVSQGRICLTSHQHASVFQGRICLTSHQHASVSQGRICSDNCACCHTQIEAADQTCYLTQSEYADTRPTSVSTDSTTLALGRVAMTVPVFKSLFSCDQENSTPHPLPPPPPPHLPHPYPFPFFW